MSDLASDLDDLAEQLLGAAAAGHFEAMLVSAEAAITVRPDLESGQESFRYRTLFFDLALVSTSDRAIWRRTALEMLAAASDASPAAWQVVLDSNHLDEIRRLALEPADGIEILELLTYAPDEGIRDFARTGLETIGTMLLATGSDSRSIERLLHATGASSYAYRLERDRKRRQSTVPSAPSPQRIPARLMPRETIALAGGHAQLRGTAAVLLERYGVRVIQIPSSREAVRRERDIVQTLQGCDLVLLLVRQLTHSTSDQVRRVAVRLGIPVQFSNALSAVAIERQLLELSP